MPANLTAVEAYTIKAILAKVMDHLSKTDESEGDYWDDGGIVIVLEKEEYQAAKRALVKL